MVDIFKFANVYAVKPEIMRIIEDEGIQQECRSYVAKPGTTAPPFAKLFALYCNLKHGTTLKEWIQENQLESLNIDVRRFISFGVIKGFLYRVHKYPVLSGPVEQCTLRPSLKKMLDGKHHYDAICTLEGISPRNLDQELSENLEMIKFIWR